MCATFIGKLCFTGNSKGILLSWPGNSAGKDIEAHKGTIGCLFALNDTTLLSGGADGKVIIWKVSG